MDPAVANPSHCSLRPITDDDLAFLQEVYASTRAEEMALVPWTQAEKSAFLAMQFQAQHTHYQRYYPRATFDVILLGGKPVGRLYVDRGKDDLRIVDIALLPGYRNRGIGGYYLQQLQQEATQRRQPVTIHVERNNPALRFYKRLGFTIKQDKGVYVLMAWQPAA